MHWQRISRNRAGVMPSCGLLPIRLSTVFRNRRTISPRVWTSTASPRSVRVLRLMYCSCAGPSASFSPAADGSGYPLSDRFRSNRWFCWFLDSGGRGGTSHPSEGLCRCTRYSADHPAGPRDPSPVRTSLLLDFGTDKVTMGSSPL